MFWQKRPLHSNDDLVDELERKRIIRRDSVKQAMKKVDRKNYVLDRNRFAAYYESPQSIGHNATISAPIMHAYAAETLRDRLNPGSKVLDVGSGSGYLCAVFHHLVGSSGKVVGVEHIPELVTLSEENLKKDGLGDALSEGEIQVKVADGRLGYPAGGPYGVSFNSEDGVDQFTMCGLAADAIHVGASSRKAPQELIDQLASPGTMFIPVGVHSQVIMVVDKDESGKVKTREMMNVIYVPLTSKEDQESEGSHE